MLLCTNISCKNVKIYIYMFNIQRNLIINPKSLKDTVAPVVPGSSTNHAEIS